MITADALARELGCTLSDLADLNVNVAFAADNLLTPRTEDLIRAAWSKRTGVDYTVVPARKTITDGQLYNAVVALGLDPYGVISIEITANPRTVHVKQMTNPFRTINGPENEYVKWSTETVQ